MRRSPLILTWLTVAVLAMFVLAACDDEPTQAEANEAFCDAVGNYMAALRDVQDLNRNSSLEEVEEAAQVASDAYESMVEAAAGVVGVRLDDLEEAREELQNAVDDVSEDTDVGDALDEVDDEITNVVREASQVLNDVACSLDEVGDPASDE